MPQLTVKELKRLLATIPDEWEMDADRGWIGAYRPHGNHRSGRRGIQVNTQDSEVVPFEKGLPGTLWEDGVCPS